MTPTMLRASTDSSPTRPIRTESPVAMAAWTNRAAGRACRPTIRRPIRFAVSLGFLDLGRPRAGGRLPGARLRPHDGVTSCHPWSLACRHALSRAGSTTHCPARITPATAPPFTSTRSAGSPSLRPEAGTPIASVGVNEVAAAPSAHEATCASRRRACRRPPWPCDRRPRIRRLASRSRFERRPRSRRRGRSHRRRPAEGGEHVGGGRPHGSAPRKGQEQTVHRSGSLCESLQCHRPSRR